MRAPSFYRPVPHSGDHRLFELYEEINRLAVLCREADEAHCEARSIAHQSYPPEPSGGGRRKEWRKQCAAIDQEHRVGEMRAKDRAATKEWGAALDRLALTRARTLPGIAFKLRLAWQWNADPDGSHDLNEQGVAESALRDLMRLLGRPEELHTIEG